jgi:hypothetical protein
MKEVLPGPEHPEGQTVPELPYTKAWEELSPDRELDELSDRDVLRTLGVWNRYRSERGAQRKMMQGHTLRPNAVLPWIRKINAGESLPDELSFVSPDSPQELREESEAAFDALAFVEEYKEKRKEERAA